MQIQLQDPSQIKPIIRRPLIILRIGFTFSKLTVWDSYCKKWRKKNTVQIQIQGKRSWPSSIRSCFPYFSFAEMSMPRTERSWCSKFAFLNWRPTMPASFAASTFRTLSCFTNNICQWLDIHLLVSETSKIKQTLVCKRLWFTKKFDILAHDMLVHHLRSLQTTYSWITIRVSTCVCMDINKFGHIAHMAIQYLLFFHSNSFTSPRPRQWHQSI